MPTRTADPAVADLPEQSRAYVVWATTDRFDVASEPENDINPIPGHSALSWLGGALRERGYGVSEPDTEDWGWYVDVERFGERWLLGASGTETRPGFHDWVFQVVKRRSVLQILLRRARMRRDDPLFVDVCELVRADGAFEAIHVEGDR